MKKIVIFTGPMGIGKTTTFNLINDDCFQKVPELNFNDSIINWIIKESNKKDLKKPFEDIIQTYLVGERALKFLSAVDEVENKILLMDRGPFDPLIFNESSKINFTTKMVLFNIIKNVLTSLKDVKILVIKFEAKPSLLIDRINSRGRKFEDTNVLKQIIENFNSDTEYVINKLSNRNITKVDLKINVGDSEEKVLNKTKEIIELWKKSI